MSDWDDPEFRALQRRTSRRTVTIVALVVCICLAIGLFLLAQTMATSDEF